MNLSSVFKSVAHKTLVAVDLPNLGSNQHELNGNQALREFFGTADRTQGTISWFYFSDEHDPLAEITGFTFYDARQNHPRRTEWRLYYPGSFLGHAEVGDRLYLARSHSGQLFGLVFQNGSSWLSAAAALFGDHASTSHFHSLPRERLAEQELEILRSQILEHLGISVAIPPEAGDEELVSSRFGDQFPTTRQMGEFARAQTAVDLTDPDETLVRWLTREEELFRALESIIIGDRLRQGFGDVDEFIEFSLSVQNRRKSRMGHALQNHLAEIFSQQNLRFTAQGRTEGGSRPDFLFPGESQYHDQEFAAELLTMLGVKSSIKERWRQVLDEADRIARKHLCTLEPSLSLKQTEAMQNRALTLVIPASFLSTHTPQQQALSLTLADFISLVKDKQNSIPA